jgi:hypothetical protein
MLRHGSLSFAVHHQNSRVFPWFELTRSDFGWAVGEESATAVELGYAVDDGRYTQMGDFSMRIRAGRGKLRRRLNSPRRHPSTSLRAGSGAERVDAAFPQTRRIKRSCQEPTLVCHPEQSEGICFSRWNSRSFGCARSLRSYAPPQDDNFKNETVIQPKCNGAPGNASNGRPCFPPFENRERWGTRIWGDYKKSNHTRSHETKVLSFNSPITKFSNYSIFSVSLCLRAEKTFYLAVTSALAA